MTLTGNKKLRSGIHLAVLAFVASWAAGCGVSPPPDIRPAAPNVASLEPQDWYVYYSAGMPSHPSSDASGKWSFEFPILNGHVNYIQTPFNVTTVPHTVTLTFRVESDAPQYKVIDAGDKLPATVHLFFEQRNDDLRDPNGRWWSFASGYNLGSEDNSTVVISVPLTPDVWSNVEGKHDSEAFYLALANMGWIGITCGGQSFWGHGVAVNAGSAKYVLVDLQID